MDKKLEIAYNIIDKSKMDITIITPQYVCINCKAIYSYTPDDKKCLYCDNSNLIQVYYR